MLMLMLMLMLRINEGLEGASSDWESRGYPASSCCVRRPSFLRGNMRQPSVCSEAGRRHDSGVSGPLQLGNGQNTCVWKGYD
jgi:hypothetical protein